MKILFLAALSKQTPDQVQLLKFYDFLSQSSEKLGMMKKDVPSSVYKNHNQVILNSIIDIDENDWDLVIIHSAKKLVIASKKVITKPIIFLATNQSSDCQGFQLPNLYKVIVLDLNIDPCKWGIPKEFIYYANISPYEIPSSPFKPNIASSLNLKVLYFSDPNDHNLNVARSILQVFNYFSQVDLIIVIDAKAIALLKSNANDNIQFIDRKKLKGDILIDKDLIIASGEQAKHALCNGATVLVAGIKGLGGLVNEQNAHDFIKIHFHGRPGGSSYEQIPAELLLYEIQLGLGILDEKFQPGDLRIYTNYLYNESQRWKNELGQVFLSVVDVYHAIETSDTTNVLVKLSQNMTLQQTKGIGDSLFLVYQITGKTIGFLDPEEVNILQSCIQERPISEIFVLYGNYSAEDIVDFLIDLWKNKVVHFRLI